MGPADRLPRGVQIAAPVQQVEPVPRDRASGAGAVGHASAAPERAAPERAALDADTAPRAARRPDHGHAAVLLRRRWDNRAASRTAPARCAGSGACGGVAAAGGAWAYRCNEKEMEMDLNKTEIENAKRRNGASGSTCGYSVEARYNYARSIEFGEQIFDTRWQEVHFVASEIGIPARRCTELAPLGLYERTQAEALRWWFLAALEASRAGGSICWETRLVKHHVEYTRQATPTDYINAMDSRGNLPADMAQLSSGGSDD